MKAERSGTLSSAVLLVLSTYTAISTIVVTVCEMTKAVPAASLELAMSGAEYFFRAFTNLSNCIAGIVSIPVAVYAAASLFGKRETLVPRFLAVLVFVTCSATSLTFFTVLLGFAPQMASRSPGAVLFLYDGYLLLFHLINPVVFTAAFLIMKAEREIPLKAFPLGAVPAVLYGIMYTVEVVLLRKWTDFYNFTRGGSALWSAVSAAAVLILALVTSFFLIVVKRKISSRTEQSEN